MEKTYLPERIDSVRVFLERHSLDLAEQMYRYVDLDRDRLREFLPWVDSTRTVEDERDYIRLTHENWVRHELFDYGIFRKEDSLYLGNVGVHNIAWSNNRCEIGYWILGAFEGKGYVSEAVRALERVLFSGGFNRIEICCSSVNRRSANVPRALGFSLEGVFKEDAIENGRYRDTLVFAKRRSQWQSGSAESATILGLDHTLLFVKDMEQSKTWYRQVLGIAPSIEIENFCEFRIGTCALGLHPADSKSPLSPGGQVAYWRVPDFQKAVDQFVSHGGEIYRGPLEVEDGLFISQIRDPFGNAIGLIGRKA